MALSILYLSNEQLLPLLGGGSAGNFRILLKMLERGHRVVAATPLYVPKEPIEEKYGVTLEPFSPFYMHRTASFGEIRYPLYVGLFYSHIVKLAAKYDFDLVFIRNCLIAPPAFFARRLTGKPVAVSMTDIISGFLYGSDTHPKRLVDLLVRWEARQAMNSDRLFVITEEMKNEVIAKGGPGRSPEIAVTGDGVDGDLFDPRKYDDARIKAIRREYGLSGRVVMYHGIIDPYHGLEELIRKIIAGVLDDPEAMFLLAARGGGYENIKDLYRSEPRVQCLDFVPYEKIPALIAASDAGIIPYRPAYNLQMIYTLKLLEYLAMGNPVVTFRLQAVESTFGSDGFVSFAEDVPDFCTKVKTALRRGKSKAARDTIHGRFTWDCVADKICEGLEEINARDSCKR